MRTAVVLFTRDLRVHDQPALAAAARGAERVVPLFVEDAPLRRSAGAPNRLAFLAESLACLDGRLRELGGRLVVRRGEVVEEVRRLVAETGADAVHMSRDVSAYAQRREERLADAVPLRVHEGITVVPPDALSPAGGGPYKVFSPYWRAWLRTRLREVEESPARILLPDGIDPGTISRAADDAPRRPPGGETAGRARMDAWLAGGISRYGHRDRLDLDATSRLSPYLHFGCISPLELVQAALTGTVPVRDGAAGRGAFTGTVPVKGRADAFVREVVWRDFYAQLLLHRPETSNEDFHGRGDAWDGDEALYDAWRAGETGYPVVDAGMRQLSAEGWMHNRTRLITASFLTKHLYLDWRLGATHFFDLLVDGDVANNVGNWQWVAGTGVDTRPYRVYNPTLQAQRHDPDGDYVRRWVPELAHVEGAAIHEPWKLPARERRGYPDPVVDHAPAVRRFRERRSGQLTLTDA